MQKILGTTLGFLCGIMLGEIGMTLLVLRNENAIDIVNDAYDILYTKREA